MLEPAPRPLKLRDWLFVTLSAGTVLFINLGMWRPSACCALLSLPFLVHKILFGGKHAGKT